MQGAPLLNVQITFLALELKEWLFHSYVFNPAGR